MKIIAIGDIHGRDLWKDILADKSAYDKVVFIGDYFDTHGAISPGVQMANFSSIIAFRNANPERVVVLLGNHDFHYIRDDQQYSGFQDKYASEIRSLVQGALDKGWVQVAYEEDGWLFTHAGVTKQWADLWGIKDLKNIPGAINGLFYRNPISFNFTFGESGDIYGGAPENGPLWVRPESLANNSIDIKQVVGHTTQKQLLLTDKFAFIDCLGTSKEYLHIVDGVAKIKQL